MSLYYAGMGLERSRPATEGEEGPHLVVVIVLAIVVAPEVGHGEDRRHHHTRHQAKPQYPPEGTGWFGVVTRVVVVNVLLGSCKSC